VWDREGLRRNQPRFSALLVSFGEACVFAGTPAAALEAIEAFVVSSDPRRSTS
jgi:hypothetical protein